MNERQKKIMVPYEEKTDTCPDCSNHPCDCGMPAGYKLDIRFACNFAPHIKVVEASKVAQIIEQRDRLAEALEQIASTDPNWRDCLLIAREALQSLNPDHAVDANDMIAAVKGGADE